MKARKSHLGKWRGLYELALRRGTRRAHRRAFRSLVTVTDKLRADYRRAHGLTAMRSAYGPPQRRKKGRR